MLKSSFKKIILSLLTILIGPLIIVHFLSLLFTNNGIFLFSVQLLSLIPGKLGSLCRITFNQFAMTYCHSDIVIGFMTIFSQRDTELHKNIYIGPQCNIGSCIIEKNTLIASGVHIMSGNKQHNINDIYTPIQQQGGFYEKVVIGEDTWIGNGCLIMANIGKKCVIGAGAVVTKDIPDYSIAVGNPAKVIKSRLQ
jgi:virginiamycin A acetyltransferase